MRFIFTGGAGRAMAPSLTSSAGEAEDAVMHGVLTIDAHYGGHEGSAAVYLIQDAGEVAFVETNTTYAVPRMLAALEQRGRRPEDVRYIAITHVHLDHAGGAGPLLRACPRATLLAHPRAAKHVVDPSRLVAAAKAVYGPEKFEALYGRVEGASADRVRAVRDDETFALGRRHLRFFETRGHANHHVCIHDDGSNGVFTGDSFGLCYPHLQRERRLVFPTSAPSDFDAEAALQSVDRITGLSPDRVFLTHFGPRTDVDAIARRLRTQLEGYAKLVDTADASSRTGDELASFCVARVGAEFEQWFAEAGLTADPRRDVIAGLDVELNGLGIAAAVEKRRYKRSVAGDPTPAATGPSGRSGGAFPREQNGS